MMLDVGMSLADRAVMDGLEDFRATGQVTDGLLEDVERMIAGLRSCVQTPSAASCPPRAEHSLRRAVLLQSALRHMRTGSVTGQADAVAQSLLDDFFKTIQAT